MSTSALTVVSNDETRGYGTPLLVKLSRISPLPNQPRQWFDPIGLESLADDIRDNGQQQPVRLVRNPEQAGSFLLIGGERRWRAFHKLWERAGGGSKEEPVVKAFIEVVKNMKELFKLAFLDNLKRENLIPLDEAAAYHHMRTEDGMSIDAIAEQITRSRGHVDSYLKVHDLPDSVKELMSPERPRDQQLLIQQAIDIARGISPADPVLRLSVAREAIDRQLDTAETRMLVGVRSGTTPRSFGGRLRKPADDHKVLMAFITRVRVTAKRMETQLHIPSLYQSRADGENDMRADAAELQAAIKALTALYEEFQFQPPAQAKRKAS